MASLDHRGNPTRFPGDGNSPKAIIDREFNYYGEDFYFYSGGVLTSARTLIGGGVPPNIVLQNTGGFTAGRIPFANANGYALVDSANLTWNSGTNTLSALNLEVNGGDLTVLPGAGVTTLNSAITRINNNNFTMPQFGVPDQYKLLWVSNGATSSVGITPYTMPPAAGAANQILVSNGSNFVYSTTLQVPASAAATTNRALVSNGIAGESKYTPYEFPGAVATGTDASLGSVLAVGTSTSVVAFRPPTPRVYWIPAICFTTTYMPVNAGSYTLNIPTATQNSELAFTNGVTMGCNIVVDLRGLQGAYRLLLHMRMVGFNAGEDNSSFIRLVYGATFPDFSVNCPPTVGTTLKEWKGPLAYDYTGLVSNSTFQNRGFSENGVSMMVQPFAQTDSVLLSIADTNGASQLLVISVNMVNGGVGSSVEIYGLSIVTTG